MTLPVVCWLKTLQDQTAFVVAVLSEATGWPGIFNGPPVQNTKNFWAGFKTSEFKDIRDLVNKMGKFKVPGATMECGQTDLECPPQPLPDKLEWTGFVESHMGPYAAYCDDTIVFEDENCALHFNTTPAVMPYKKEECSGASRLTFYWMALHGVEWQVYINCAPLEGGSYSSNSTSKSDTDTNVKTPTTTPSAYAPAPPADDPTPAPPADDETPSAYAPEPLPMLQPLEPLQPLLLLMLQPLLLMPLLPMLQPLQPLQPLLQLLRQPLPPPLLWNPITRRAMPSAFVTVAPAIRRHFVSVALPWCMCTFISIMHSIELIVT